MGFGSRKWARIYYSLWEGVDFALKAKVDGARIIRVFPSRPFLTMHTKLIQTSPERNPVKYCDGIAGYK